MIKFTKPIIDNEILADSQHYVWVVECLVLSAQITRFWVRILRDAEFIS